MWHKTIDVFKSDIEIVQEKIIAMFIDQCTNGAQAKGLLEQNASACGQFIGQNARQIPQRGLHGTAAALRVLADSDNPEARSLVPKLVNYIGNRLELEKKVGNTEKHRSLEEKVNLDENNVIKISEILYSLSFVKKAVCPTDHIVSKLTNKLEKRCIRKEGWGFFLNSANGEIDLLPTAYAIRGLASVGGKFEAPLQYLLSRLKANPSKDINSTDFDIMTKILSLFTIAFVKQGNGADQKSELLKLLSPIWKSVEPLLSQELEQNIEYSFVATTFYVRVPWQLYLIALASHLSTFIFGSSAIRNRLKATIKSAKGNGFKYPHSGKMSSSRTNAILYDTLSLVKKELNRQFLYWVYYQIDRIRNALSARWVGYAGMIIALTLIIYSIKEYWLKTDKNIADLGPNFICAFVISLMYFRKNR
ncbi:MAG: hypothetical protein ACLQUW_15170 [Desulfobaccales bacterium]